MTMNNNEKSRQPDAARKTFNVVFGSGGSKAVLTGMGAVLAFELSGLKFATIGGCSGGSIPAFLMSGMSEGKFNISLLLSEVLDVEFTQMVKPKTSFLPRLWALAMKFRHEARRTRVGVYTWEPLKMHFDGLAPEFPKNLWIAGAHEDGLVLMTADGTHLYREGNRRVLNWLKPVTVGTAISASCAVPGVIDLVPVEGKWLYDGALSYEGACPTQPISRHFGHDQSTVIAFDVGEDSIKEKRWFRLWWQVACGRSGDVCGTFEGKHAVEQEGRIVITPVTDHFHGLKFVLTREEKWHAILAGFKATFEKLKAEGLVSEASAPRLFELYGRIQEILASGKKGREFVKLLEGATIKRGYFNK